MSSEKPLDAEVERFAFIGEDGSADDYLVLTFVNRTSADVLLVEEKTHLTFKYNDRTTEFLSVRDWNGRSTINDVCDQIRTERAVVVPIDGNVPAGTRRAITVKVRHRDLARRDNLGGLTVYDPLYALGLPILPVERIRYQANLVFPSSAYRREIDAQGAQFVTSRTAVWTWGAAINPGENLHLSAIQRRGALTSAPRRIDDAIAEAYRLLAGSYLWEWPKTEPLRRLLAQIVFPRGMRVTMELPDEDCLVDEAHSRSEHIFRKLLEELYAGRDAIIQEAGSELVLENGVMERSERLSIQAEKLRTERGVIAPFPSGAAEALMEVLHYQARQRERPASWSDGLDEAEFHRDVERQVGARRRTPGSEVPLAGGFLDLLIGETPVELKVADLRGAPIKNAARFRPQTAQYAAGLGFGLAILLVLDEHVYSKGDVGPPGLDEQCRVDVQETKKGVSGAPTVVVVVTVVVLARLTAPSTLRPKKKAGRKVRTSKKTRKANGKPRVR
ncbi:hypothetical protein [Myxococcus xanthus]|uniref:hypothetical protein n=1 Tax=Myxococcus xanthus TaxID=34 RepID=UPI00112D771F|nr:hypothetical protein [Myxococcus xanthus]